MSEIASEHKKLFFFGCLVVALSFFAFTISTKLIIAYNQKLENEIKIEQMQIFVKDFDEKAKKINKLISRPIKKSEIDHVQTSVLLNMQKFNINLKSLKEPTPQNETNGHIFQAEVEGDFNNTVNFLRKFCDHPALIGIKSIEMNMKQNVINTKLTYKIYTID